MKKFHSLAAGLVAVCATFALALSGSGAAQASASSTTITKVYSSASVLKTWKPYDIYQKGHCAVKPKKALHCVGYDTIGSVHQLDSLRVTGSIQLPAKIKSVLAKGGTVHYQILQTTSGLQQYRGGWWQSVVPGGNPMNNYSPNFSLANGTHGRSAWWTKVHKKATHINVWETLNNKTSITFKSFKVVYKYKY